MSIMADNIVNVDYFDMKLSVPIPEAYVLHKIIINDERKPAKKEKDINSIHAILPHLDEVKLKTLEEQLTKNELKIVRRFLLLNEEE